MYLFRFNSQYLVLVTATLILSASMMEKNSVLNITFEQLCSLYLLDKNLRNSVIAAMLDLEEHIKEAAADVIAKSFDVNQNDYLLYKNYQNKRKYKSRFTLSGVLKTLTNTLETDKEPIHHYQTKYGIVPPWILFKRQRRKKKISPERAELPPSPPKILRISY